MAATQISSAAFAASHCTPPLSPELVPDTGRQAGSSACSSQGECIQLAASAEVGQVEGTIPQVYQDYMADMEVLWGMVMNEKDARKRSALMGGFSAIKTLLLDRGYDA